MLSKPLVLALLAAASVTAAAGGAYFAARHSDKAPGAPPAAREEPNLPPVHETEAVVAPPVGDQGNAVERETRTPSAPAPPRVERAAGPRPTAGSPSRRASERPTRSTAAREQEDPTAVSPARPAPAAPVMPPVERVPDPPATHVADPEAPLPPVRIFEDLVIPASSVLGLQIESPVSSERASLEDRVEARVLRDVTVDGRAAIPAGSRAIGAVTLVERGGKLKERAQLGVRFHTLVLADGTSLPIRTDTILREGDSPSAESARKIGGAAAGGAILGAIIGGKKGAILGGATGAAGGTAIVVAGDRNPATLPVGAVVTVRLSEPLVVEVERH